LNLIDEVGGYQDAIDLAADIANIKDPTVEEYEGPSFLDSIFGSTSGEISILRKVFGNQILGSELANSNLALLDYARTTFGMPQYRYGGN
jgi:ClpP class serine protease